MEYTRLIKHFYYWGLATYNIQRSHCRATTDFKPVADPAINMTDKSEGTTGDHGYVLFELNDLYDSLYGVLGGNIFRATAIRPGATLFTSIFTGLSATIIPSTAAASYKTAL